jgi:hemoglobin/transferrin/lactoferrin receptor protein
MKTSILLLQIPLFKFQRIRLLGLCLVMIFGFFAKAKAQVPYEYVVTVNDEQGQPLFGVNVYTDDQKFVSVTDESGKVKLVDIGYSTAVNFSYIGYTSLQLPFFKIRQAGGVLTMTPALDLLPTIVVIGRRDQKPQEIPYLVSTVDKKAIAHYNPQTTADALAQNENIYVQRSQMGGGSINIRGFEANKVLLVVDGVRMNNIIFRAGHLQDAIKMNAGNLERIEVIYGPGSLNYGSDALGGVVHFRTKEPKLYDGSNPGTNHQINSSAYARFASANLEKTLFLDLNYGSEKWGSYTSLSYSDFDDLRAGSVRPDAYPDFGKRPVFIRREGVDFIISNDNENIQSPSGYGQFDFLQKLKFQPSKNQNFLLNLQYSTSTNVPRYDVLQDKLPNGDLRFAEWFYGPQKRLSLSLKSHTLRHTAFFSKATMIASFQKVDEDRYNRGFRKDWRIYNLEDVFAFSLTTDFDKNIGERSVLTYGLDLNHDLLYSLAGQINTETEKTAGGIPSRYPNGGNNLTTIASYANFNWQTRDTSLTTFAGLRYTWTRLFSIYDESPDEVIFYPDYFYTDGLTALNSALTWSAGIVLRSRSKWELRLLSSTAFHAPNVDDFAKFREKNFYLLVPNPELKPEHTINGELTLGKEFGSVDRASGINARVSATGFYTLLSDAIVRSNFKLSNGDSIIVSDGFQYRVQANVNALRATIFGGSGNFLLTFGKHFSLTTAAGYTRGRVVDDGEDLGPHDHIPPFFGRTTLDFRSKAVDLSFVVRYNGKKPIDEFSNSGEDNEEYATPQGSLAWTTYNFYSTLRLGTRFAIDAAIENILDLHYRQFSSGISAPGRNLIFTLRGNF